MHSYAVGSALKRSLTIEGIFQPCKVERKDEVCAITSFDPKVCLLGLIRMEDSILSVVLRGFRLLVSPQWLIPLAVVHARSQNIPD